MCALPLAVARTFLFGFGMIGVSGESSLAPREGDFKVSFVGIYGYPLPHARQARREMRTDRNMFFLVDPSLSTFFLGHKTYILFLIYFPLDLIILDYSD